MYIYIVIILVLRKDYLNLNLISLTFPNIFLTFRKCPGLKCGKNDVESPYLAVGHPRWGHTPYSTLNNIKVGILKV